MAEIVNLHKKFTQSVEKLEDVPLSNKKLRKKWMSKVARARVAVSRAIRKIPFYLSQWKQFAKEIERVVEEISHLEADLRKVEGRNSQTALARAISSALQDPSASRDAALRLQSRVRTAFSADVMTDAVLGAYAQALENRHG